MMSASRFVALLAWVIAVVAAAACATPQASWAPVTYVDAHTLRGPRNFVTGYETRNADGTYNLVVEIPTGTSEKWEICKSASLDRPAQFPGCTAAGREMVHEVRNGVRRVVTHLGYPGNYGSLPQTLAGDGDPLDVIAIGPPAARGSVIPVKIVGVFRCLDGTEQDDKVVAITEASPLYPRVSTAGELSSVARGAAALLHLWFESYKPGDDMACASMADEAEAMRLIAEARTAFTAAGK
jgi:inorganic pyrophosphatase